MTKKVLISWNELEDALRECGVSDISIVFLQDWFEELPDVSEITTEKINYGKRMTIEEIEIIAADLVSASGECGFRKAQSRLDKKSILEKHRQFNILIEAIKQYGEPAKTEEKE